MFPDRMTYDYVHDLDQKASSRRAVGQNTKLQRQYIQCNVWLTCQHTFKCVIGVQACVGGV